MLYTNLLITDCSGFAAVHAIVLVRYYRFTLISEMVDDPYLFGDPNMQAIWCILSASWFMVVPLLSWSSSLRQLEARPILIYWSFLILIGITCTAVSIKDGYSIFWAGAAAICSRGVNATRQFEYMAYQRLWDTFNCTTQCGSLSPSAVLRPGGLLVSSIQIEFPNYNPDDDPIVRVSSKVSMQSLTEYIAPFVGLQYIYALWSDRLAPSQARNYVCARIFGGDPNRNDNIRKALAVIVSFIVYFQALLSLVVCLLLFTFNIIFNEMTMVLLPQDETVNAVGQWSPIVSTVLVILAAILSLFHPRLIMARKHLWGILRRNIFNHRQQYHCEVLKLESGRSCPRLSSPISKTQLRRKEQTPSWETTLSALLRKCSALFARAGRYCQIEWREFWHWTRDPVGVSLSMEAQRTFEHLLLSGREGPSLRSKERLARGTTPVESTRERGRLRSSRGSWNQGRSHSWG